MTVTRSLRTTTSLYSSRTIHLGSFSQQVPETIQGLRLLSSATSKLHHALSSKRIAFGSSPRIMLSMNSLAPSVSTASWANHHQGAQKTFAGQLRWYTPMTPEEEDKEKARVSYLTPEEKDAELRKLNRQIAKLEMLRGINNGEL